MSAGTFSDFLVALGKEESGDNYSYVSPPGYLGYYQFAEVTLEGIGWYNGDSTPSTLDWTGSWSSKAAAYGVTDKASFLANPAAQNEAELERFAQIDQELHNLNLTQYVGQTIHGVKMTLSGLMAGSTLVGSWALKDYLTSGGATMPHDGNGVTVENYIQWFGGYDTPYDTTTTTPTTTTPTTTTPTTTTPTPSTPTTPSTPASAPTVAGLSLTGGAGSEQLDGGTGADTLSGGDGNNTLHGGAGNDSITAGAGFNQINGNQGDDTIVGHSQIGDWLSGGQGNDSISVQSGAHNLLLGNMGNDTITAGSGGDTLRGGQGDDVLTGGAGRDWLSGDKGHDTLTGGAGADTFHTGPDMGVTTVTDFHVSEGDKVLLDHGSTYTTTQSGADVVVDLGGGTEMILKNTQLSQLGSGWLVMS